MLEVDNGTYECNYYPVSRGQYLVAINWGGHSIPRRLVDQWWMETLLQCFEIEIV